MWFTTTVVTHGLQPNTITEFVLMESGVHVLPRSVCSSAAQTCNLIRFFVCIPTISMGTPFDQLL